MLLFLILWLDLSNVPKTTLVLIFSEDFLLKRCGLFGSAKNVTANIACLGKRWLTYDLRSWETRTAGDVLRSHCGLCKSHGGCWNKTNLKFVCFSLKIYSRSVSWKKWASFRTSELLLHFYCVCLHVLRSCCRGLRPHMSSTFVAGGKPTSRWYDGHRPRTHGRHRQRQRL